MEGAFRYGLFLKAGSASSVEAGNARAGTGSDRAGACGAARAQDQVEGRVVVGIAVAAVEVRTGAAAAGERTWVRVAGIAETDIALA